MSSSGIFTQKKDRKNKKKQTRRRRLLKNRPEEDSYWKICKCLSSSGLFLLIFPIFLLRKYYLYIYSCPDKETSGCVCVCPWPVLFWWVPFPRFCFVFCRLFFLQAVIWLFSPWFEKASSFLKRQLGLLFKLTRAQRGQHVSRVF